MECERPMSDSEATVDQAPRVANLSDDQRRAYEAACEGLEVRMRRRDSALRPLGGSGCGTAGAGFGNAPSWQDLVGSGASERAAHWTWRLSSYRFPNYRHWSGHTGSLRFGFASCQSRPASGRALLGDSRPQVSVARGVRTPTSTSRQAGGDEPRPPRPRPTSGPQGRPEGHQPGAPRRRTRCSSLPRGAEESQSNQSSGHRPGFARQSGRQSLSVLHDGVSRRGIAHGPSQRRPAPFDSGSQDHCHRGAGIHHVHKTLEIATEISKPENILLDKEGKPKLTDFGLWRSIISDVALTSEGSGSNAEVSGTPGFIAPSKSMRRFRPADYTKHQLRITSDLFALGATLYCSLTCRIPYHEGTSRRSWFAAVVNELVPVQRHNPTVDDALDAITQKCLSKHPDQRFASADELADVLEAWLSQRILEDIKPLKSGKRRDIF